MDKEIRIEKPQPKTEAKKPILPDIAQKLREYSKEEQIGLLNLTINDLIQDRLTSEMFLRLSDEKLTASRKQTDIDKYQNAKVVNQENIQNTTDRLRILRQLKAEIEDGRLAI